MKKSFITRIQHGAKRNKPFIMIHITEICRF
jgi:hypothetical protein